MTSRLTVPILALVVCLISTGNRADAQTARGPVHTNVGRANTWSASTATGRVLMGTWTANPDAATGSVTGTWTLTDPKGTTLMLGGWSAIKTDAKWSGSWRAIVSGQRGEYAGTWTADAGLNADAPLADLFVKAVTSAVSGQWRAGGQSGAWSIRAYTAPPAR